jgi:hypothetical protein
MKNGMGTHAVHEHVLDFIRGSTTARFEELALEVFRHQFEMIPAYRRVCEARRRTPETVTDWRLIPPVPALAFKQFELRCAPAERTFLTTGTSQGAAQRGRHGMPDLRLYRAASMAGMKEFMFPDIERMRILSLIAPAAERPESSLAQMVDWAIETYGSSGSATFAAATALEFESFAAALRQAEVSGEPLCILATTGALIRFFDACRDRHWAFRLAHSSRLMDTGGNKGAPRTLSRNGVLHAVWQTFAIPGYFCVNEYGMAELSSQFYDNVIRDREAGRFAHRAKTGPAWMRTRILDPATLDDVDDGEPGLLCHFDLANAGTALAVLTEDIGNTVPGGFEILGRAKDAEARGCSLALAEFTER